MGRLLPHCSKRKVWRKNERWQFGWKRRIPGKFWFFTKMKFYQNRQNFSPKIDLRLWARQSCIPRFHAIAIRKIFVFWSSRWPKKTNFLCCFANCWASWKNCCSCFRSQTFSLLIEWRELSTFNPSIHLRSNTLKLSGRGHTTTCIFWLLWFYKPKFLHHDECDENVTDSER